MKRRLCSFLVLSGLLWAASMNGFCAHATLGEQADSIDSDQGAFSAIRRDSKAHANYTVQNIESASNHIREYVSPSNKVFGIAWNGLTHPDLNQLLGSYTNDYQEGLKQSPRQLGRRSHSIKTSRVVIEKWGHMRNLQGRAYVPSLIPSGVSLDEIK